MNKKSMMKKWNLTEDEYNKILNQTCNYFLGESELRIFILKLYMEREHKLNVLSQKHS